MLIRNIQCFYISRNATEEDWSCLTPSSPETITNALVYLPALNPFTKHDSNLRFSQPATHFVIYGILLHS